MVRDWIVDVTLDSYDRSGHVDQSLELSVSINKNLCASIAQKLLSAYYPFNCPSNDLLNSLFNVYRCCHLNRQGYKTAFASGQTNKLRV